MLFAVSGGKSQLDAEHTMAVPRMESSGPSAEAWHALEVSEGTKLIDMSM